MVQDLSVGRAVIQPVSQSICLSVCLSLSLTCTRHPCEGAGGVAAGAQGPTKFREVSPDDMRVALCVYEYTCQLHKRPSEN